MPLFLSKLMQYKLNMGIILSILGKIKPKQN